MLHTSDNTIFGSLVNPSHGRIGCDKGIPRSHDVCIRIDKKRTSSYRALKTLLESVFAFQASVQQLDVVAVYNWARKAALTPHPAMAGAPAELVAAAEDATSLLADLPTSALVEGARRGDARLAVQFGGQGVDYLQELRDA